MAFARSSQMASSPLQLDGIAVQSATVATRPPSSGGRQKSAGDRLKG